MANKLLDVPHFIQEVNARAVTNSRPFDRNMEPTEDGLQSPSIFGVSPSDKFDRWGYITLEDVVMHPLVLENLSHIDPIFNRVYQKKKKYSVVDGMLVEDEGGGTGIGWLISVWDKINFDKYRTEKNKIYIDFIKNTKSNLIFINKIPVIPIVYREARMGKFKMEEDEVDALYKRILSFSQTGRSTFSSEFAAVIKDVSNKDFMQESVNALYKHFISKLEGKPGFMRQALTAKRLDNVSRMVANANPDIPVNSCVIPWHILLNMFDVFVAGYLANEDNRETAAALNVLNKDTEEFGNLFDYIYRNTNTYTKEYPAHKELWITVLENIFNTNPHMRVLVKRDPGWTANSMHCLRPLIGTENMYHIMMPAWSYAPLGGDSFNTNFMIDELPDNVLYEDDEYKITSQNTARVVRTMNSVYRRIKEEANVY